MVVLLPCAAAADPPVRVISPELGMDKPVFGPAWNDQTSPAVAHDGKGGYLVVWADQRRTSSPTADIYAARVDSAGKLLDRGGILVSKSLGYVGSPAVSHDGKNFFVVWHSTKGNKQGARVSPTGKVLDKQPVEIAPTKGSPWNTDVAHGDKTHLLVWQEGESDISIVGALVNTAGTLLQKFPICTAGGKRGNPRVAADENGTFLVIWQDYRSKDNHVYGARVTSGGKVLDTNGVPISTVLDGHHLPSVAYGGGGFLVVWHTNSDIRGTRVTVTGNKLQVNKKGIDVCIDKNIRMAPSVTYGGGKSKNFLVVWKDFRDGSETDIYGTRVTASGKVLETKGIVVSAAKGVQDTPRVAGGAKGYLVVWEDNRVLQDANIYAARVNPGGKVLDPGGALVSSAANRQAAPDVTYDGAGYLAVWQDHRKGAAPSYQADIHGARLGPTGKALDPAGVTVQASGHGEVEPVVAHQGAGSLVAWRSRRSSGKDHLMGALVSASKVLAPTTLDAEQSQKFGLALAFGKGVFLLGWYTPTLGNVRLTRLDKAGKKLDTIAAGTGQSPAVAHGGTHFLVVWSIDEYCLGLTCPKDIKRPDGYPCSGGRCVNGLCISPPDAGAPDGAFGPPSTRGCSCEAATPAAAWWLLGLALLALLARARRSAPWR